MCVHMCVFMYVETRGLQNPKHLKPGCYFMSRKKREEAFCVCVHAPSVLCMIGKHYAPPSFLSSYVYFPNEVCHQEQFGQGSVCFVLFPF